MPFLNNNVAAGLPAKAPFQVGVSNVDNGENLEYDVKIPWAASPLGSYLYYDCTVGTMLDSGIVVHNRLPQHDGVADTLSSSFLSDSNIDKLIDKDITLACKDQYKDIVQRMGHARYWFRLWGQAIRVGYKVPIPGIKTIGGVPTIPYDLNPQMAFNRIMPNGNFSGLILWYAQWSLWYTTAIPPINNDIPAVDLGAGISGDAKPPASIQAPFSQADDNAKVTSGLPINGPINGFIIGGAK